MKLIVRNASRDPDAPDLRVYAEDGDEIEDVQFVSLSRDAGEVGLARAEMAWFIEFDAGDPSAVDAPDAAQGG
ncbi:MAG: hypothetical protein BGO49_11135 [Planctomycetales bacterium 71-10]|nr:MAG: hypothetical protein BGO49_11135 [Planctomycetales bacterium 71-10]